MAAKARRGMSIDEKRAVILDVFHETKEVYLLKDIERLASRRGVVLQSVKDVLQSLVDDDLVHQEKIGISNFFWSFPGEAAVKLEAEIASLTQKLEERKAYEGRLKEDLRLNLIGKEITQEKETLARQVGQLEGEIESKRRELEMYTANDPERFEALKQAKRVAMDSANRWTDNILTLQSWMKKRFNGMDAQLENFFQEHGVDENFDYIEAK